MRLSGFWSGLDWSSWSYGLIKGAISGGATAVLGAFSNAIVDPHDFALGSAKSLHVMLMMFVAAGALQTFAFLSKTPLPDKIVVEKTQTSQTTTDAKGAVVTIDKTVEKTTQVVSAEAPNQEKPNG